MTVKSSDRTVWSLRTRHYYLYMRQTSLENIKYQITWWYPLLIFKKSGRSTINESSLQGLLKPTRYMLHVLTLVRILASHFIHELLRDNARVVDVGTNALKAWGLNFEGLHTLKVWVWVLLQFWHVLAASQTGGRNVGTASFFSLFENWKQILTS